MFLTNNTTYWDTVNKNSKNYPIINSNQKCDVLIIGGGIAGCITCYYLSLYNIDTILVEKNHIGSRDIFSTAFLSPETDEFFSKLIDTIGEEKALRVTKLCQKSIDEIQTILFSLNRSCDFHKTTSIHLSKDSVLQKKLFEEYTLKKNYTFPVELINSTTNNIEAIYSSSSGIIDPIKLCHTLLKAASSKGAKIYEQSPVNSINIVNGVKNVTFTEGKIKCNKIIYTTSSNSLNLTTKFSLNNTQSISIVSNTIDNIKNSKDTCYVLEIENGRILIRTTEDNRLLGSIYSKETSDNSSIDILLNGIKYVYPDYKDLKIDYLWRHKNIETASRLPIIGKSKDSPNSYYNLPFGINNLVYSLIGATILKDLLLYNNSPDADIFSFPF